MLRLRLHDRNFHPDAGSSKYWPPREVTWLRDGPDTRVTFYTDQCLDQARSAPRGTFRVAWLLEPEEVYPDPYRYIEAHLGDFDLVLTHHASLTRLGPKVMLYPNGMTWVAESDWREHPKDRNVSIIASAQRKTGGHRLRHSLIARAGATAFDVWGGGYRPIDHKITALGGYRFSVVIENSRPDGWYFTEKLLDCFATYTIPIYWGCPRVGTFFDTAGMILATTEDALLNEARRVASRGAALYESMLPAMRVNHDRAREVAVAEDWIIRNVMKPRGLF
jgi:hypothetical protein